MLAEHAETGLSQVFRRSRNGVIDAFLLGQIHIGVAFGEGLGRAAIDEPLAELIIADLLVANGATENLRDDRRLIVKRKFFWSKHRDVAAACPAIVTQQADCD